MTSLLKSLTRSNPTISLNDLLQSFQFGGVNYGLIQGGTPGQHAENIEASFTGYTQGAYKTNGIVYACMATRALLFSEARFQFRQMRNGRPGDLFGTQALGPLEQPWVGGTTGDLLTQAIQDSDLAGNFYAVRRGNEIRRLRPDWVTIVLGSKTGSELDVTVAGYEYKPGGPASGEEPVRLLPEQVCHFVPPGQKDPVAHYRGMSWLTPILSEIMSDESATNHKLNFFQNGAKLGYVVTLNSDMNPEMFERWKDKFKTGHEGDWNAYKTLFLAGGADVKLVGADMKQVDFSAVQGHGETRICAAARIPPILVGLSEGLQAATYSNYGMARRAFADLTLRPMWRNFAGSIARIVDVPAGADLWYDDRDIPFLQEDQKDRSEIQKTDAITAKTLIDAGYEPDSVIKAVTSGDLTALAHTGLFSVQLHPAGTVKGDVLVGGVTPVSQEPPPEPQTPAPIPKK